METITNKLQTIQQLQRTILSMQQVAIGNAENKLGLGCIEQAFPEQRFPRVGIHEFSSHRREAIAATNGFLAAILSKLMNNNGHCLWIGPQPQLYAPGLAQFNIDTDRIIFVQALKNKEILWTIEEALKCASLSAVVGEISQISFTESRRLQLAVENSKVTGFIHRHYPSSNNTIASVARWEIQALPSLNPEGLPGIGHQRWLVNLLKVRNGQAKQWPIAWQNGQFHWAPAFSDTQSTTQHHKNYG